MTWDCASVHFISSQKTAPILPSIKKKKGVIFDSDSDDSGGIMDSSKNTSMNDSAKCDDKQTLPPKGKGKESIFGNMEGNKSSFWGDWEQEPSNGKVWLVSSLNYVS